MGGYFGCHLFVLDTPHIRVSSCDTRAPGEWAHWGPRGFIMIDRCIAARQSRLDSAEVVGRVPWPDQINNGEEGDYPYLANYSKGLPHNDFGEVDADAYNLLLR